MSAQETRGYVHTAKTDREAARLLAHEVARRPGEAVGVELLTSAIRLLANECDRLTAMSTPRDETPVDLIKLQMALSESNSLSEAIEKVQRGDYDAPPDDEGKP